MVDLQLPRPSIRVAGAPESEIQTPWRRSQPAAISRPIRGCPGRDENSLIHLQLLCYGLGAVLLHPSNVPVHPALQELSAGSANAAIGLEQAFFSLDKCLGLAKRGSVKVGQGVAKMLLRDRGANCTDRHADDPGRLAGKRAVPVRT